MQSINVNERKGHIMIEIGMDREALPAYDASAPHKRWKETYGGMLSAKTIFDCED